MKHFLIYFGALAATPLAVFGIYCVVMFIIDARLPDIPTDNTAAVIQECPKLQAAIDRLKERILALGQAERNMKGEWDGLESD